jgi:hypothetical protein
MQDDFLAFSVSNPPINVMAHRGKRNAKPQVKEPSVSLDQPNRSVKRTPRAIMEPCETTSGGTRKMTNPPAIREIPLTNMSRHRTTGVR